MKMCVFWKMRKCVWDKAEKGIKMKEIRLRARSKKKREREREWEWEREENKIDRWMDGVD